MPGLLPQWLWISFNWYNIYVTHGVNFQCRCRENWHGQCRNQQSVFCVGTLQNSDTHECTGNTSRKHMTNKTKLPKSENHDPCKTKLNMNGKDHVQVNVIGASMVRSWGKLIAESSNWVKTWCYPNPGFTTEKNKIRLPGMISKCDYAIVILGWTNNVPRNSVGTCLTRINELVKTARALNDRAHIVISEMLIRFDNIALNSKIEISMFSSRTSVRGLTGYTQWVMTICSCQMSWGMCSIFRAQGKRNFHLIRKVSPRKSSAQNRILI